MVITNDLLLEGRRYYINRYGCWMNDREGDTIAGILESHGASAVESAEQADIVVFNTCSVSGVVETKICSSLSCTAPETFIIVCGCYSQYAAKELIQKYPYINVLIGAGKADHLTDCVTKALQSGEPVIDETEPRITPDWLPAVRESKSKAYVSIMNGCSNCCSFCIVPHVRGPAISRNADSVISEIQTLVRDGWREVTLVGHNVQQYAGKVASDSLRGREIGFTELLKMAIDTGIERIRFLTSNPADLKIETLRLMAEEDSLCPSLHLPLQSGSDAILSAMFRRYTKKKYIDLAESFYDLMPEGSLTTDVIVGFPGETEEDFNQTYNIYQQLKFDGAYVFAYSPRPFTEAAGLPHQISGSIKFRRYNQLQTLCDNQRNERAERFNQTVQRVLIVENNGLQAKGYSESNWPVVISENLPAEGEMCDIIVSSVKNGVLYGTAGV